MGVARPVVYPPLQRSLTLTTRTTSGIGDNHVRRMLHRDLRLAVLVGPNHDRATTSRQRRRVRHLGISIQVVALPHRIGVLVGVDLTETEPDRIETLRLRVDNQRHPIVPNLCDQIAELTPVLLR